MYRSFGIIHVKCYVRMYLVYVFFRKDSMKVNMDKIRQYEGSRKKKIYIYIYVSSSVHMYIQNNQGVFLYICINL